MFILYFWCEKKKKSLAGTRIRQRNALSQLQVRASQNPEDPELSHLTSSLLIFALCAPPYVALLLSLGDGDS